jgi:hypothetical protein
VSSRAAPPAATRPVSAPLRGSCAAEDAAGAEPDDAVAPAVALGAADDDVEGAAAAGAGVVCAGFGFGFGLAVVVSDPPNGSEYCSSPAPWAWAAAGAAARQTSAVRTEIVRRNEGTAADRSQRAARSGLRRAPADGSLAPS